MIDLTTKALRDSEATLTRQIRRVRAELDAREEAERLGRIDRLVAALPSVHPVGESGPITVAECIVRDVPPGIADSLIAILTQEGTS